MKSSARDPGPESVAALDRLDAAPEGSFSIVVIPDTQGYRGTGTAFSPDSLDPVTNPVLNADVSWILNNLDRQQIVFVSHVGDVVDRNVPEQWESARALLDRLHGIVPYGISLGNRDMTADGDSTLYQRYFGTSRFREFAWYGGSFAGSTDRPGISTDNADSYQLFSAEGLDFLFLHLECNAPDDVLEWANSILDQHRDRVALITCHMGLGPRLLPENPDGFFHDEKGRMLWSKIHGPRGNSPQQIWEKCYRKHPSLFAVFSGDQIRTEAIRTVSAGDFGNPVHELVQDYGCGWLRLYRFRPDRGLVDVFTFDPNDEKLCPGTAKVPDREAHQFQLAFPFR